MRPQAQPPIGWICPRQQLFRNVCDEIAEVIDPSDLAGNFRGAIWGGNLPRKQIIEADRNAFEGISQGKKVFAARQSTGGGGHEIAAMKCMRNPVISHVVGKRHDGSIRKTIEYKGEQAIIGRDEELIVGAERENAPRGTNAGIDNGQMHGSPREVVGQIGEEKAGRGDILRGDGVGNVDDWRFGSDSQNCPLHLSDIGIGLAKIGGQ